MTRSLCFGITAERSPNFGQSLPGFQSYLLSSTTEIFLVLCNSMAYQNSIYVWGRDHRVHHKYTETNADPVNSKRGFFFAHMGWLMCKKHPDVTNIGRKVDCSDMMADPVVYHQHKYNMPSVVLMCFVMPTLVPWYFWSESLSNAYFVAVILRYVFGLNSTWLVNSAAHMWGTSNTVPMISIWLRQRT